MKHPHHTQTVRAHVFNEHSASNGIGVERFFATFRTHDPLVPFVEVTVVAGSRQQAKQRAQKVVAPLGLYEMELD